MLLTVKEVNYHNQFAHNGSTDEMSSPSYTKTLVGDNTSIAFLQTYPRLVRHIVGSFLEYAVAMCEVVLDIWADVV